MFLAAMGLFVSSPYAIAATSIYVIPYDKASDMMAWGTFGYNYVMKDVTKFDVRHVSSLYVDKWNDPDLDMVEVGWVWYGPRDPKVLAGRISEGPHYFTEYSVDGNLAGPMHWGSIAKGTNHWYKVSVVSSSGTQGTWRWYINDTQVWGDKLLPFRMGRSQASSERWTYDDSNYSRFWNLQRKDGAGRWSYWQDMWEVDQDKEYDNFASSDWSCEIKVP